MMTLAIAEHMYKILFLKTNIRIFSLLVLIALINIVYLFFKHFSTDNKNNMRTSFALA